MKKETKIKITEYVFFIIILSTIGFLLGVSSSIVKKNFGFNIPLYMIILLVGVTGFGKSIFISIKKYLKEKIYNYYK